MDSGTRLQTDFTPAVAGAPLPDSAYNLLQDAAGYFSDERIADAAPPWLRHMAKALAQQGRHRILTPEAAEQMNLKLAELRQCFDAHWMVSTGEAPNG